MWPSFVACILTMFVDELTRCIIMLFSMRDRPDDTAWEDGTFKLSLEFTEEYPNKAPKVKFLSTMFHPNGTRDDGDRSSLFYSVCFVSISPQRIVFSSRRRFFLSSLSLSRARARRAVYADGSICLDILQNQWSPIYDIAAILTSIQVRVALGFCVARFFRSVVDFGSLTDINYCNCSAVAAL